MSEWNVILNKIAVKLAPAMQSGGDVIGQIRELGGWRVYPVERGGKTVYVTIPE